MVEWFMDFTLQYFDVFLIAVLIVLTTLVLSIFIKRKRILIMAIALLVLGASLTVQQSKYTTFLELYDKTLKEESVIEAINIRVYDPSNDFLEPKASKSIEDQDTIESIIDDLSKIDLKKEEGMSRDSYKYHVEIIVKNQAEEDRFLTRVIDIKLDENALNDYKIISSTNHLKTLKAIFAGEDAS
ncbi:hypothetical protein FZC84_09160 [Rossellomorea vietnamensis]|uniref:Uncharacterized protein n=1 Tax=Rossellomorea vietnamensis TaxID=218284 RepID=A0A5D4MFZ7_9BACI|nr:hypothetical protein [Rossellomorea vietnamensis]TYR99965.1 hypothetical protein FZC84_09160 [Rossellomorea vietnamensis]